MDEEQKNKIAHLLVRLALGFIFFYAGLGKLFFEAAPQVDQIITFMPPSTTLLLLGILELTLGLLLILGLITRVAATVAGVVDLTFIISGLVLGMFNTAM